MLLPTYMMSFFSGFDPFCGWYGCLIPDRHILIVLRKLHDAGIYKNSVKNSRYIRDRHWYNPYDNWTVSYFCLKCTSRLKSVYFWIFYVNLKPVCLLGWCRTVHSSLLMVLLTLVTVQITRIYLLLRIAQKLHEKLQKTLKNPVYWHFVMIRKIKSFPIRF